MLLDVSTHPASSKSLVIKKIAQLIKEEDMSLAKMSAWVSSGMSFWRQTYVPELFEIVTLQTEVFRKLQAIVTAGRKRTVRWWQTHLNQAAKSDIGKIYRHVRPIEQSPLTILKLDRKRQGDGRNSSFEMVQHFCEA